MTPKLALAACVPAIDWNSRSTGAPRSRHASCVVMWARQQACVGTPQARRSSRSRPLQDGRDRLDRLGRRVDADDRVAAAEQQAVDRRQQDAAEVVGRMVRLHADAEHAALAQRVAAARDVADLAGGQDQVLVAHQLGDRRGDLRRDRPLQRAQLRLVRSRRRAGTRGTRRRSGCAMRRNAVAVERVEDQPADVVRVGIDERAARRSRRAARRPARAWRRPARARTRAAMPASWSPDFSSLALAKQLAQVGEDEPLAADGVGE